MQLAEYTVHSPPVPCRVHTPTGAWHGMVLARHRDLRLVLHGPDGFSEISWLPDEERLLVMGAPTA